MSFSTGNSSNKAEINVTPLIDVLLVLLIIFMVLVPKAPYGLKAVSPEPAPKSKAMPIDDGKAIVVQVHAHHDGPPTYTINEQPVLKEDLVAKLIEIFALRQDKTMFVKGDADLEFRQVAEVVGLGHQASIANIGVLTPKMEKGE